MGEEVVPLETHGTAAGTYMMAFICQDKSRRQTFCTLSHPGHLCNDWGDLVRILILHKSGIKLTLSTGVTSDTDGTMLSG